MTVRTLIFAKAPRAGLVKTRLIPALGPEGAARLAARMLDRMLASAREAAVGVVELCAAPAIASPAWRMLELPRDIAISEQGEGDLGARLARNAERVITAGEPVMLVGTDCLELDAATLRAAARALDAYDSVIHPTVDGGYALLGLNRFDPSLFDDIAWSTPGVTAATLQRLSKLGWSVEQRSILHDIDEPGDLALLPREWRLDP